MRSPLTGTTSPRGLAGVDLDSLLAPGRRVRLDPYGLNPLAVEAWQLFPGLARLATTLAGPAPKMFTGGEADLPAFTASGIDPEMLLRRAPYRARHHLAAVRTIDAVLAGFRARYADDPTAYVDHEGLQEATARVRAWLNRAARHAKDQENRP